MVKQSFDLHVAKDSSNTDEAAQNGGTPKSVTLKIHHGWCFTPTPSRSYVGGQPASYMEGSIIVESVDDSFEDLNEILEGVGPIGKFKEVKVDADNKSEEESDNEVLA
nr:hypothetical protein [Tanacetum cinerariifolium]